MDDTERRDKGMVFGLTWVAYAAYYLGRKGFSVVKVDLQKQFGLSVGQLGNIDTAYLAAYAVGQFFWGSVGDRIGSRKLLGWGMIAAGGACAAFGVGSSAAWFMLAFLVCGLFQSTGWSGSIKAMGEWFDKKNRGAVMGMWGTCYQVGGVVATWVATWFLAGWGWRWAFWGPGAMIAGVGVVLLVALPEKIRVSSEVAKVEVGRGGWELVASPVIWSLGGAYFCLKLIRYSILFWLPYYLHSVLGYGTGAAGYQSVSFEVGGVLGAVAVGALSDRLFPGRRRIVASVMCVMLACSLVLYIQLAPISHALNFLGMAIVGFCLFGPDTLVAGAAAQDAGGKYNVAKAAGLINGMGSIGAVLQGGMTAMLSKHGWNTLFYAFVAMAAASAVVLLVGGKKSR